MLRDAARPHFKNRNGGGEREMGMVLDFLFQIWRRLSGPLQWRLLWLVNAKFMVSVSGVIFDESGRILLQRHRHWAQEVWGLPGGIVQAGERLEEALEREVLEESGIKIEDIRLIRMASGYRLRMEGYYQAHIARAEPAQGMRLQKKEVLEAKFFSPNELPANLLPLQRSIIGLAKYDGRENG
jgi:ADP-ribose pyrophosphatase YjhB (NUDIX family)